MRKVRGRGPVFIAVQDIKGNVFGGYFSQEPEFRKEFFGSGESFLYKIKVRFFNRKLEREYNCVS